MDPDEMRSGRGWLVWAFLLLAMTVAAAALRRHFPAVIADAFFETRLGKPWRSTYGMLDSRFDARAFINFVFPPV